MNITEDNKIIQCILFFLLLIINVEASGRTLEKNNLPNSPVKLLKILENKPVIIHYQELNYVKDEHITGLMELIDSDKECFILQNSASSMVWLDKSTVGDQAAILIKSYWKRFYPSGFHTGVEKGSINKLEIRSWYLTWKKLYKIK